MAHLNDFDYWNNKHNNQFILLEDNIKYKVNEFYLMKYPGDGPLDFPPQDILLQCLRIGKLEGEGTINEFVVIIGYTVSIYNKYFETGNLISFWLDSKMDNWTSKIEFKE